MIRERIVVDGRVQRVGYRDLVQGIAWKLGVKGYVENLKDGRVQIVCEAEEEVLESFMNARARASSPGSSGRMDLGRVLRRQRSGYLDFSQVYW